MCIITGCGGVFTADSGLITTPPHLTAYKNDQNCTWLITVDSTKNVEFKSVSIIALVIFVTFIFTTIIIIVFWGSVVVILVVINHLCQWKIAERYMNELSLNLGGFVHNWVGSCE